MNESFAIGKHYDVTIWRHLHGSVLYDISKFSPDNIMCNTGTLKHLRLDNNRLNGRLLFSTDDGEMCIIPTCCIVMMLPSPEQITVDNEPFCQDKGDT